METLFTGVSASYMPSPDLGKVINFYWYVKLPKEHDFPGHLFYPNGQVVLVLNLADPILLTDVQQPALEQRFQSVFIGHHPRGLLLNRSGTIESLCLYVSTAVLRHLNRFALRDLADHPLLTPEEVFGRLGKELEEEAQQGGDVTQKIGRIETYLRRYVQTDFSEDDAFLTAKNRLRMADGQLSMAQLSDSLGISYKSLQRLFVNHLGLPPKQYARSLRFIRAYEQFNTRAYEDLLGLAVRNGYYDESHFHREFKYFTNTTPTNHHRAHRSALFEPSRQLTQMEATPPGMSDR